MEQEHIKYEIQTEKIDEDKQATADVLPKVCWALDYRIKDAVEIECS